MTPPLFQTSPLIALALVLALPLSARAQLASDLDDPSGVPRATVAPDGSAEADPVLELRMDRLLADRANGERVGGVLNGIVGLAAGGLLLSGAIWMAADDEAFGGFGGASPAMVTGLAVTPVMFAWGIYSLLGTGSNDDRRLRWRAAREGGLSAVELARFEGELRAEANAARVSRMGTLALGIGIAAGGALTTILGGALDDFDDELRWITIGGGAGIAALGGLMIGLSFLESGVEQLYSRYRAGEDASSAGLTVQPVISPTGVGMVGTF